MRFTVNKKILLFFITLLIFSGNNLAHSKGFISDTNYFVSLEITKPINKIASATIEMNNNLMKKNVDSKSEIKDWQLFLNPYSNSSKHFGQPTGIWLTEFCNDSEYVKQIMKTAENKAPVFVVYFSPSHDNKMPSKPEIQDYLSNNIQIAKAISKNKAIIILEPDLLYLSIKDPELLKVNQKIIKETVDIYKTFSPNSRVYLDAGHSDWLTPFDVAEILEGAGINDAHGFATNISNFQLTENELEYAEILSDLLGNKKFIIDTGRNGNGPGKSRGKSPVWSDPLDISVGISPTTITKTNNLDAYLWVKPPGEADGSAYPAGTWHPELVNAD